MILNQQPHCYKLHPPSSPQAKQFHELTFDEHGRLRTLHTAGTNRENSE